MTSFAFIMGVLPMARATGAGAYSRNSLGIVIASGMLISTILGRFVIPVYYVLGERIIRYFSPPQAETSLPEPDDDHAADSPAEQQNSHRDA
jgi:HAE1 family hydrophobic/amphiphilic exporter-1